MARKKADTLRVWALLFVAAGIVYFNLYLFYPRLIPGLLLLGIPNQPENLLVIGSDYLYDIDASRIKNSQGGNSDTLILLNLNPFNKKISALSIPRDTLVNIRGYGMQKINAAYFIGGPNFTMQVIADNFGIHPTGYLALNLNGVPQIVDTLGGIKIYIDKDMFYEDRCANLHIDLKKGEQVLNGQQAVGFIRFRMEALGDIARVSRQQEFIKQLARQMLSLRALIASPRLLSIVKKNSRTNLSFARLVRTINLVRTVKPANIQFYTLPGSFAYYGPLSIWKEDKIESEALIKKIF
ncbi:MAG: LCP family protein [Candidatus Margulisiibacteriota bacterium]